MRADLYLVEKGIAQTRQKAQNMISEGLVYADGIQITKPSKQLNAECVEIRGELMPYVSRGGLKLKAAIECFGISCEGLTCIDIGASTGGFTDCLIQHGAAKVYAVDCGHGQLDRKLLGDGKVVSIEGCNARDLTTDVIPEKLSLCVMDVSFISQTLIHPVITDLLREGAEFVTLIKPQFEAGRSNIGKNGIVKNEKARKEAVQKVIDSACACGFVHIDTIVSPITGGDGNIEYIGFFRYENSSNS